MSGDKDIRFIEPTNYIIQPHPKKGMVGILMQSFPSVIRSEAQANAVLVFVAAIFATLSMIIILSGNTTAQTYTSTPIYYESD